MVELTLKQCGIIELPTVVEMYFTYAIKYNRD